VSAFLYEFLMGGSSDSAWRWRRTWLASAELAAMLAAAGSTAPWSPGTLPTRDIEVGTVSLPMSVRVRDRQSCTAAKSATPSSRCERHLRPTSVQTAKTGCQSTRHTVTGNSPQADTHTSKLT